MTQHLGEIAALGTALCWAFTAMFFADASTRVGSLVVNFLRLVFALAILSAVGTITRGQPWPTDASAHAWGWLSLSGLIGFAIGDLCLFRALVLIGPRLASLLMSFAPPIAALIGWLILGETLLLHQLAGMGLTLGGVVLALRDRAPTTMIPPPDRRTVGIGILLALGGAAGQAGGLVLSKLGMGSYDAMAATQIRVFTGVIAFAAIFTVTRRWPRVVAAVRQPRPMLSTGVGAIFGPFLGVWLSLVAVQHTTAGVAASLMATSPILIIPLTMWWQRERVGVRDLVGTIAAVAGVVLLVQ